MRIHHCVEEIVKNKATAEALKPWYMRRCKRPCYDDEYLPAFNRPNLHLVDTDGKGITEIRESGPVFEGKEYPLDLLIYATGFEVQVTGIYNDIRGKNGLELNHKYAEGMRTVFGIQSHGYPNPFIMGATRRRFSSTRPSCSRRRASTSPSVSNTSASTATPRSTPRQKPSSGGWTR